MPTFLNNPTGGYLWKDQQAPLHRPASHLAKARGQAWFSASPAVPRAEHLDGDCADHLSIRTPIVDSAKSAWTLKGPKKHHLTSPHIQKPSNDRGKLDSRANRTRTAPSRPANHAAPGASAMAFGPFFDFLGGASSVAGVADDTKRHRRHSGLM